MLLFIDDSFDINSLVRSLRIHCSNQSNLYHRDPPSRRFAPTAALFMSEDRQSTLMPAADTWAEKVYAEVSSGETDGDW